MTKKELELLQKCSDLLNELYLKLGGMDLWRDNAYELSNHHSNRKYLNKIPKIKMLIDEILLIQYKRKLGDLEWYFEHKGGKEEVYKDIEENINKLKDYIEE